MKPRFFYGSADFIFINQFFFFLLHKNLPITYDISKFVWGRRFFSCSFVMLKISIRLKNF